MPRDHGKIALLLDLEPDCDGTKLKQSGRVGDREGGKLGSSDACHGEEEKDVCASLRSLTKERIIRSGTIS
jgi:hypothetical protein